MASAVERWSVGLVGFRIKRAGPSLGALAYLACTVWSGSAHAQTAAAVVLNADDVTQEAGAITDLDVLANDLLPSGKTLGEVEVIAQPGCGFVTNRPGGLVYRSFPECEGLQVFYYGISGSPAFAQVTVNVTAPQPEPVLRAGMIVIDREPPEGAAQGQVTEAVMVPNGQATEAEPQALAAPGPAPELGLSAAALAPPAEEPAAKRKTVQAQAAPAQTVQPVAVIPKVALRMGNAPAATAQGRTGNLGAIPVVTIPRVQLTVAPAAVPAVAPKTKDAATPEPAVEAKPAAEPEKLPVQEAVVTEPAKPAAELPVQDAVAKPAAELPVQEAVAKPAAEAPVQEAVVKEPAPAAPEAGKLPVEEAVARVPAPEAVPNIGGSCAAQVSASFQARPGGLTEAKLSVPCASGTVAELDLGEFRLGLRFDGSGNAEIEVPGLRPRMPAMLKLADGSEYEFELSFSGLNRIDRVAVAWDGEIEMALHALEFGALPGTEGDVSPAYSRNYAEIRREGGGFLTVLAPVDGAGQHIQVYSYLTKPGGPVGAVRLELEYVSRGRGLSGTCGDGVLAQPDFTVMQSEKGLPRRAVQRRVAGQACGGVVETGGAAGDPVADIVVR